MNKSSRAEALHLARANRIELEHLASEYLDAEREEEREEIMDQIKRVQRKLANNLREAGL